MAGLNSQFSEKVLDPLGTDLAKSASLRPTTLANETGKTNLPQQTTSFYRCLIFSFWSNGEIRENFLGQLFRWHFCEAAIKMPQIAHNGDLERQGGGSLVDESGFQGNWWQSFKTYRVYETHKC